VATGTHRHCGTSKQTNDNNAHCSSNSLFAVSCTASNIVWQHSGSVVITSPRLPTFTSLSFTDPVPSLSGNHRQLCTSVLHCRPLCLALAVFSVLHRTLPYSAHSWHLHNPLCQFSTAHSLTPATPRLTPNPRQPCCPFITFVITSYYVFPQGAIGWLETSFRCFIIYTQTNYHFSLPLRILFFCMSFYCV
jgi:hypothetical protein